MIFPRFGVLPLLHDPLLNERVLIETLGDWQLFGPDRRSPAYTGFFLRNETPLQLLHAPDENALVSILTPSRATENRFEYVIGNQAPVRQCCYSCVRTNLRRKTRLELPNHQDWIVYMLLESNSYLSGPAPKERSRA